MGTSMRPLIAALTAVIVLGIAIPVCAQDVTVKVGLVEIEKIQAGYVQLQQQQASLEQWLSEQRTFFNLLTDYIFLSVENFDEVMALLKKGPLAAEEQARLDELKVISDDKDKRFRELEAKPDRNAQEQDEHNSLLDIYRARGAALEEMWKETLGELGGKREEAIETLMLKVREAISAEAEAQGMTLVVDADAVFFGGTDMTEAVLTRLNNGQTPPAPAAGDAEGGG